MSRIGSRQIEERLSGSGVRSHAIDDARSDEVPSSGNMLFAGLVVGLLVVGAGIGFAASDRSAGLRHAAWESIVGPPPPPPYISRVAEACDQGWKDDRENRDQIHCHMTREIARLCEPRERRALVDKLYAYQDAIDRSEARVRAVAINMIGNPGSAMAMGMAEARSRDPNSSAAERAEQFNKTLEMSRAIMSPMNQITMDNHNATKRAVVIADVKSLVEHGYLAAADFSSTPPKVVADGLAAVRHVDSPSCQ